MRYPGAVIEKVERETKRRRTVYDVDLELDGGARDCEVHLEPDGSVVESKEELDAAGLPAADQLAVAPGVADHFLLPQILLGGEGQPPNNRGWLPPSQDPAE